jgi:hypothetical protein
MPYTVYATAQCVYYDGYGSVQRLESDFEPAIGDVVRTRVAQLAQHYKYPDAHVAQCLAIAWPAFKALTHDVVARTRVIHKHLKHNADGRVFIVDALACAFRDFIAWTGCLLRETQWGQRARARAYRTARRIEHYYAKILHQKYKSFIRGPAQN